MPGERFSHPALLRTRRLHRAILGAVVAGILVLSLSSGLMVFLTLYRPYRQSELGRLRQFVLTRQLALHQYAQRVIAVAQQVSRRTRARLLLEGYLAGTTTQDELVSETKRILTDAMAGDAELLGISRLSSTGELLVSTGRPIPAGIYPPPPAHPESTSLTGPFLLDRSCVVSARAAIRRDTTILGYDVVLLACREVATSLGHAAELAKSGQVYWGARVAGRWRLFELRDDNALSEPQEPQPDWAARVLAEPKEDVSVGTHEHLLLGWARVPQAEWALVTTVTEAEYFSTVYRKVAWGAGLMLVLAAGGAAGVVLLLRPLSRGVLLQTEEMEREIHLRDEFLSIASHELYTPLTSLQLSLQGLQQGMLAGSPEAAKRATELSERQVKRLGRLIGELLSVSRIQAGRLQLRLEDVDLVAVARDVAEQLRFDLTRAGSALSLDAGEPVVGRWDRQRLEQVITNVLSNAIKFGAGKPIEVVVTREDGTARLVVRDHGIGITPDRLPHIFERFERGVSATQYGGLGLGLFIVHQIVSAHRGAVRVQSTLGEGSTFTVELPGARSPSGGGPDQP